MLKRWGNLRKTVVVPGRTANRIKMKITKDETCKSEGESHQNKPLVQIRTRHIRTPTQKHKYTIGRRYTCIKILDRSN